VELRHFGPRRRLAPRGRLALASFLLRLCGSRHRRGLCGLSLPLRQHFPVARHFQALSLCALAVALGLRLQLAPPLRFRRLQLLDGRRGRSGSQ